MSWALIMFKKIILGTLLSFSIVSAQAGIIEYSSGVDYTNTDFSNVIFKFDQFDDLDGTLNLDSINFTIFGEVLSTAQVENFSSNSGAEIHILVSALLGLNSSTGQTLVSTLPTLTEEFSASEFDGAADWSGTSGATFDDLYSSNSESALITDEDIISLFVGNGTVDTYLFGTADTRASGGGNTFSGFNTSARASVNITYNYSNEEVSSPLAVSEPSSFGVIASAIFGIALFRRKAKK